LGSFFGGSGGKSKIKNQNAKIQIKYQRAKLGLIGFVLHNLRIGTKEVWVKLGLMGFVFLVGEGGFIFLILCHNSS